MTRGEDDGDENDADEADGDDGWPIVDERGEHEPDEFDPDSLGPDVPEPPEAPSTSSVADADVENPEIARQFWQLVLVFNVALLALSVGAMFVGFRGNLDLGLKVLAVGVLTFALGLYRYHRFESDRDDAVGSDAEHNG